MEDGGVVATFEVCCLAYVIPILFTVFSVVQIISMIGWGPADSQPKPCKRGSATRSLKELATPSIR
jgi:hypothetical protein